MLFAPERPRSGFEYKFHWAWVAGWVAGSAAVPQVTDEPWGRSRSIARQSRIALQGIAWGPSRPQQVSSHFTWVYVTWIAPVSLRAVMSAVALGDLRE